MAYDYNKLKQQYEGLNDQQKQQFAEMNKNDTSGNYQKFMDQYNAEKSATQNNSGSNFNNQNGTNGQNQTNFETPTVNKSENQNETPKVIPSEDAQRAYQIANDYLAKRGYDTKNNQVSPDLDQSKFNQDPGKITVQEGTAQQTGKPDYGISTDARLNEMKGNLDHYFATSPRMFQDRETFNKMFDYNNRESEAQKQLLDSYWKRKEDMDKASQYTSGESINNGLKNSQITTDQLNLIKEYNPEAYRAWQEQQEEEIKLRIINGIVPPLMEQISSQMQDMMNSLGIQPQEAEDIEGVYNETMDKTKAWQTMDDCNRTVKRIEEVNNKRTAIMNRYANSTGGTVSDALAAARMQKALAPYDTEMQGLQYQYQDYANLFSQKQASAYQAAAVRQMQAQENQRVWNQRLTALGFAQTAMSYRTPEQQAQLQLQTAQIQNDMNLLQTSRQNDLSLYNQKQLNQLNLEYQAEQYRQQNKLQAELTDLSVTDEAQLRANLNNVLSDYYKNYGDIIQRSQPQAVEDIIAYAKKNGISVAEALTESFIKPLQNKSEYKQKVAKDYNMLASQSIATINGKNVILTQNPNGTISYQYIDDPESLKGNAKPYTQVDSRALNNSPMSTGYEGKTLYDFMQGKKTDKTQWGGQCGKFVNDYLESIGVGRYYDNELSTKLNSVNSEVPTEGAIAVFDYGHKSSDGINHGHVGIVTKVYNDGSFEVTDSNYDVNHPEKIDKRRIYPGTNSLKGFFDPSKPSSAISSGGNETFEWRGNTYDFSKYPGWNNLTDDEKLTVQNLLTYQTDPSTLPKSGKDNGASNSRVRAAAAAIGRDYGYSETKYGLVKNAEKLWDDKALKGDISRNATSVSILKNLADSYGELNNGDIQKVNQWINNIKTQFGDDVTLTVASNMKVAAEEIAGALKGGASPSQEDTQRILDLFNGNLSNAQAQSIFRAFAKDLLDKNMTEALKFYQTTGYKPYSIYTDEVSDWVYNDMGLTDLSKYYNYTPVGNMATGPEDEVAEIYSSARDNNMDYMTGSYNGYSSDFIRQMNHGNYKK